jgi:putative pyrroloquinoline-quinone binding quinoprotein/putative pyrroloquinoline-quinone-binding quinoprotein
VAKPAASGGASPSAAAKPAASASPKPAPISARASEPAGNPGATPAPVKGKPQLQADAQHTGRSPYAGPRSLKLLGSYQTTVPSAPASSNRPDDQSDHVVGPDGTTYVDNFPGLLVAVDGSLTPTWQFHIPGDSGYHSSPALESDGTVLIGETSRTNPHTTIYALKAPTSGDQPRTAWTYDLGPGRMTSSLTIAPNGDVYAVGGGGKLAVLSADGTLKWSAQVGPSEHAAPALAGNGVVYLPSSDGNLYAVAPPAGGQSQEGGVVWKFDFGQRSGIPTRSAARGGGANGQGSSTSATVGPDGTVYVGANNSNFYAVKPDGSLKWKFEAEPELAGIWSSPALSADGKVVYFGANRGGVYAVNTADGTLEWQNRLFGGSIFASPTLDRTGVLYVGATTGHVFALDSTNGDQLAVYDSGGAVWSTPAIRPDGTLVAANRKGLIFALG